MTEINEAPRELLALAVAARPDWDHDQTWNALLAVRTAGWPFGRILREIIRLLLIEDSRPVDLRIVAGETRVAPPGTLPDDLRTVALAAAEAATERQRQRAKDADGGTAA